MKQDLERLIELAQTDRAVLKSLKEMAVNAKQYELAANFRKVELDLFPDAKTTEPIYKEAEIFSVFLRLLDFKVSVEASYKLLEAAKVYQNDKKNAGVMHVAEIQANAKKIFG